MNVPNILTVLRVLITFIFIGFISQEGLAAKGIAATAFLVASVTDFLDGYIARKYNLITNFGKIMDPIADKFLVLSAFFVFMQMHIIAGWMFSVIFIREILVTVLRLLAIRGGKVLAAESSGKIKTVLQIVVIFLILIFVIAQELVPVLGWPGDYIDGLLLGIQYLMFAVVAITLYSGISFLYNNRRINFVR